MRDPSLVSFAQQRETFLSLSEEDTGSRTIDARKGLPRSLQEFDGAPSIQAMAYFEGEWGLAGNDAQGVPILFTSRDEGASWTPRGTGPSTAFGLGVAAGRVFVTGHQGTISSTL